MRRSTPEEQTRDRLWSALRASKTPTVAQLDRFLEGLLALPPQLTQWTQVFDTLHQFGHPNLVKVYRRMAAELPNNTTDKCYFLWNAMEYFERTQPGMLAEVAQDYCRLGEGHDEEALFPVMDLLLVGHREEEALRVAEHFLPSVRKRIETGQVFPHCEARLRDLIFDLRVGIAARMPFAYTSRAQVEQALLRDVEDSTHKSMAERAAVCITDPASRGWTRADFELMEYDEIARVPVFDEVLRLRDSLIYLVREEWQRQGLPPGWSFEGLLRVVESMYDYCADEDTKETNLLDALNPAHLEQRITECSQGPLGINVPRALLMLEMHEVLLGFAQRHRLMTGSPDALRQEVARLRNLLGR